MKNQDFERKDSGSLSRNRNPEVFCKKAVFKNFKSNFCNSHSTKKWRNSWWKYRDTLFLCSEKTSGGEQLFLSEAAVYWCSTKYESLKISQNLRKTDTDIFHAVSRSALRIVYNIRSLLLRSVWKEEMLRSYRNVRSKS